MPNKSSIFGVQKSSDQDLTYIINTLKALLEQFIVVRGDGLLGLTGGKGAWNQWLHVVNIESSG